MDARQSQASVSKLVDFNGRRARSSAVSFSAREPWESRYHSASSVSRETAMQRLCEPYRFGSSGGRLRQGLRWKWACAFRAVEGHNQRISRPSAFVTGKIRCGQCRGSEIRVDSSLWGEVRRAVAVPPQPRYPTSCAVLGTGTCHQVRRNDEQVWATSRSCSPNVALRATQAWSSEHFALRS